MDSEEGAKASPETRPVKKVPSLPVSFTSSHSFAGKTPSTKTRR